MKQRFVVMRDMDDGTHSCGEYETLDEANRVCIKRNQMEEDRLKLIEKYHYDTSKDREPYHYRVEKR